ncbi:ABC transporter ATP-binding protein [Lactobacillus psittaci]|uniref:ABC-type transporter ATP-binding protein EcsA n=1 Tax=Lactobacillus psittaci DSM 15354 TaxID=1122152 RepID=A0A0R1RZN3_9LACO|nr:ABC transporter ATP-binding protein [Lactobacillus psittaci]KRL61897.1 ABC-type transporter ATP-binding protein EcsA [Lactobacillus psittaci DSM 15354]
MTLKINNLTGGYHGVSVLKDLNLTVEKGKAVALIGLNGAGKSTTIKHILGLLRPQRGYIELDGIKLAQAPEAFKQKLAYIPETPILYPELTLKEHIELTILAYHLDEAETWKKANDLLTKFRLDNKLDWLPIHFSKGMKQKVMIVCAFLAASDLLVIDEPFTGLDPLSALTLIDLVQEAKNQGKMILITSHVLSEVQDTVDQFAVLNNRKIEVCGSLNEIKAHYGLSEQDSFDQIYRVLSREQVQHG